MTNRAIIDIVKGITKQPTPSISSGIYHSPTLGLISLSGDGENWTTIADKNLGATQVYNDGDILSENNCGKYYQRGNNYGFPWVGSVTTSLAQVDATNYGPYYESDTFIISNNDWSNARNDNLRGHVTGTVEAMRGPTPVGYHIPSRDEWDVLCGILTDTFGLNRHRDTMKIYLKMPCAGELWNMTGHRGSSTSGNYWSSTANGDNFAYNLNFSGAGLKPHDDSYRSFGFSIRPFKNESVIPDSSWTILYDGSGIASGAGIFWNAIDGLISVSGDGNAWYTIQDKNLGATTVYSDGDTLSEANCGKCYQWGNNYGFSWAGSTETSSTKVDATNYGPYYYSGTYIISNNDWSSVQNDNLWGDTADTLVTRQGPCPAGYHVPTDDENVTLVDILTALGITQNGISMKIYLKMPFAGLRGTSSADVWAQGTDARYWSSTAYSTDKACDFGFDSSWIYPQGRSTRSIGYSIRPFKNEPVIPDSSWTRLY